MKKEMEDKNRALSADEKAKNLAWRMVGPRGERRLVKGAVREQEGRREENSSRGASTRGLNSRGPRPPLPSRGRGGERITTRSRRGMGMVALGGGMRGNTQENSREDDDEEIYQDALTGSSRDRLASKRHREVEEEDAMDNSEPPLKH